jgi:FkbM family methyltransferase
MSQRLIVDVGMHTGRDTAFYLQKGFRVAAVEANPALAAAGRESFRSEIECGRLAIHEVAIADRVGEISFYLNDAHSDWGTISESFAKRNENLGTKNTPVTVPCTTFDTILRQYPTPYYIKIDIEGADLLCLQALRQFPERPRFVSLESGLKSFEETFGELSLLWELGYRRFKIVNQALNDRVRCPNPPLEGDFVDARFDGECSGPFGEEAPGRWMGIEQTFVDYRKLLKEQRLFGAGGRYHATALHRWYERICREPVGWYDIHARLGE